VESHSRGSEERGKRECEGGFRGSKTQQRSEVKRVSLLRAFRNLPRRESGSRSCHRGEVCSGGQIQGFKGQTGRLKKAALKRDY